jgi:hypothetical protein
MKRFLSIPFVFITLAAPWAVCWADEAQDAIDLLSTSLKCPINTYKSEKLRIGDFDSPVFMHATNEWSGTRRELRIHSKSYMGSGDKDEYDTTARFANLESAAVTEDNVFDPPQPAVLISCLKGAECIRLEAGPWEYWTSYSRTMISVCDQDTAESVKIAIDTLINLNKGDERN